MRQQNKYENYSYSANSALLRIAKNISLVRKNGKQLVSNVPINHF